VGFCMHGKAKLVNGAWQCIETYVVVQLQDLFGNSLMIISVVISLPVNDHY